MQVLPVGFRVMTLVAASSSHPDTLILTLKLDGLTKCNLQKIEKLFVDSLLVYKYKKVQFYMSDIFTLWVSKRKVLSSFRWLWMTHKCMYRENQWPGPIIWTFFKSEHFVGGINIHGVQVSRRRPQLYQNIESPKITTLHEENIHRS